LVRLQSFFEVKAMWKMSSLLTALIMSALAVETSGGDLPTITRKLAKEPKYIHAPKYFLLVFGPEAKTGVWCVLDGKKTLYVDRNGNGDLTEEDERFVLNEEEKQFLVGDITERDGKTRHRNLRVRPPADPVQKGSDGYVLIEVEINGRYIMFTTIEMNQAMARPQDAPVRHLGGPLSVDFSSKDYDKLVRGKSGQLVTIVIGTFDPRPKNGSGDARVFVDHRKGVPQEIHPVAEITYPGATLGATRIVNKELMTDRC
jgi:hypothetical protein